MASFQDKVHLKIPLRLVLLIPFILVSILTISIVGYIAFVNGQKAVNDVAHQLRSEVSARIKDHLKDFLEIPHETNRFNIASMQQGWLNTKNTKMLQDYFLEQVKSHKTITSIYFGNTDGGIVGGGREGVDGSLYVYNTEDLKSGIFNKYAITGTGELGDLLSSTPNFDARTRPWYIGASQKETAAWNDIYILFTGQDMAISASSPVYDEQHHLLGVVSVDIFLSQVEDFLQTLDISKSGQSFIMEHSGLLVAASTGEKPFVQNNGKMKRLEARNSQTPIVKYAAEFLRERFGENYAVTREEQFDFEIDGERYFLNVSPVYDRYGLDWLIVVVIPESDFMVGITNTNLMTFWTIILALIFSILLSAFIAQKISDRISHLNTATHAFIRDEGSGAVLGSSRINEIDELTISFIAMERQLRQTLNVLHTEIDTRKQAEALMQEALDRLQKIASRVPGVLYQYQLWPDGSSCFPFASEGIKEIYRVSPQEVREDISKVFANIHPDDYAGVIASIQKSVEDLSPWQHEYRVKFEDGTTRSLYGNAVPQREEDGSTLWHGFITDITERKQVAAALEDELTRRQILFEQSPDGILIIDPQTARFVEFNTAAHEQLGYSREEFARLSIIDVEAMETTDETHARIEHVVKNGKADFETLQRTKQGEVRNIHVKAQIVNVDGHPVYYCIWHDITERKRAEAELRQSKETLDIAHQALELSFEREQQLARTDSLTGIYNRRFLFELAEREFNIATRYQLPFSMILLDIDFFKQINDTFGHAMGDQSLQRIIEVVCGETRSTDVIGRYGGDEFVILLSHTSAQEALPLAWRIHAGIADMRMDTDKGPLILTVSIGITETIHDAAQPDTVEAIFLRADQAMYAAKQAGCNRTVVFGRK